MASMANSRRMWVITGRMPRRAAPKATPVMAFSATGVSSTRRGPYFSARPLVEPKIAAASGAPRPRTKTAGALAMQRSSASFSAWTNFSCRVVRRPFLPASGGVDIGCQLIPRGEWARLGEGHRLVDLDRDGPRHAGDRLIGDQAALAQP